MNCSCLKRCAWPACFVVGLAGCQSTEEPTAVLAVAPAALVTAPAAKTEQQPSRPVGAKKEPAPASAAVAQFAPPFPDRQELFVPPQRAQGTVRVEDQNGESVELKGFVNVDLPRVVLSIDGVISPIHEGGEKYGVEVISIQPPSVVLQRGRRRWTATLE
jgi:hypothetical protein